MNKLVISILFAVFLTGCFTMGPPNNVGFGRIETISDLEGVYQNLGEQDPGAYPIYLSSIIWPKTIEIDHATIKSVEVRALNKDSLVIRASGNKGIVKESVFIEGKDFVITSGRIKLKRHVGFAGFKSGEPLVGPYYEKEDLGIDKNGNAKFAQGGVLAGLVYMVVPIAANVTGEVKFNKLHK